MILTSLLKKIKWISFLDSYQPCIKCEPSMHLLVRLRIASLSQKSELLVISLQYSTSKRGAPRGGYRKKDKVVKQNKKGQQQPRQNIIKYKNNGSIAIGSSSLKNQKVHCSHISELILDMHQTRTVEFVLISMFCRRRGLEYPKTCGTQRWSRLFCR